MSRIHLSAHCSLRQVGSQAHTVMHRSVWPLVLAFGGLSPARCPLGLLLFGDAAGAEEAGRPESLGPAMRGGVIAFDSAACPRMGTVSSAAASAELGGCRVLVKEAPAAVPSEAR